MKLISKYKPYILLHLILLFNSVGGICSKTAAGKPFLSLEWILLYGLLIFIMAVYALLWQQVLKMLPLNVAYANKAVTVVWGIMWGVMLFNETITLNNIIGAVIVIAGAVLMMTGGDKNE